MRGFLTMAMFGLVWLWQPAVNAGVPVVTRPAAAYQGLPLDGGSELQQQAGIDRLLAGKFNCVIDVTLAHDAMTSVVLDPRIGAASWFWLTPITASAAIEISLGALYLASQGKGTATLVHAAAPATDRTFRVAILG